MKREIRLEDLVGRRVCNAEGDVIGKIREVEAEWHGQRCIVAAFHLADGQRLPAASLDLANPERPRLRA